MTRSHESTEKAMVLNQVKSSAELLLPSAVQNVGQPFETPIRWHEDRYEGLGETSPDFDLWLRLGARTVYLTLQLDISARDERILRDRFRIRRRDNIWRLSIADSAPDEEGIDYMDTGLEIPHEGPIGVSRSTFVKNSEGEPRGSCVGVWSTEFRRDREDENKRQEIVGYARNTLEEAVATLPDAQLQFLEQMVEGSNLTVDEYVSMNSVRRLGSLATRSKLSEIGISF